MNKNVCNVNLCGSHLISGIARVWLPRAVLEFDVPEAHKNTYCIVTGS